MKYYTLFAVLLVSGIILSISSCKKDKLNGSQYIESVLQIDSISYPDTVEFGKQLPIRFYAILGNGCDYFSRSEEVPLDSNDDENTFKVKLYKNTEQGVSCTEQVKYLDNAGLNLTGMAAGTFYIRVVQPDGSYLQGATYVK